MKRNRNLGQVRGYRELRSSGRLATDLKSLARVTAERPDDIAPEMSTAGMPAAPAVARPASSTRAVRAPDSAAIRANLACGPSGSTGTGGHRDALTVPGHEPVS